jgi:hypothetical protein
MTEIDAGIVEAVARGIRRRRIDLLGHTPAPDDMLDLIAEDIAFARAAIAAYEEAKAQISPQDAFDLLNRLETARLERVESTWALGTTQTQK